MKYFVLTKFYCTVAGVLLDNYQISHYTDSLFPNSEFKTDQILKEDTLSYGAVVNDSHLEKCFRNLIAEDKYLLYDFTRKELTKTLKVNISVSVSQSVSPSVRQSVSPSVRRSLGPSVSL